MRYDAHNAPFAGTRVQVSPRIRLNFYPSPSTTIYAYYGRLFMPTNVEDLRAITSVAQGGTVDTADASRARQLLRGRGSSSASLRASPRKLSGVPQGTRPGIDDNTVPGSAIVTSVNIEQVKITGIESVHRVSAARAIVRVSQRRAQSRLRLRADHGRLLPEPAARRATSISITTSDSRSSAARRIHSAGSTSAARGSTAAV